MATLTAAVAFSFLGAAAFFSVLGSVFSVFFVVVAAAGLGSFLASFTGPEVPKDVLAMLTRPKFKDVMLGQETRHET